MESSKAAKAGPASPGPANAQPTAAMPDAPVRHWRLLRAVAVSACGLALLFALVVVGVSLLQPRTDPLMDTVSLLVLGPGGFAVAGMMVAAGLSIVAVAVALHFAMRPTFWTRLGATALGLGGVEVLVMGFFPTDPGVIPDTLVGYVHATLSGMGLVVIPLSFVLLSHLFGRDPQWRPVRVPALVVAWASMAVSVVYGVLTYVDAHTTLWRPVYDGLAERVLVATILVWLVLASRHLWNVANRQASARKAAG